MLNLASVLTNNAREIPNKTAIFFGDKRFTYAQIDEASNQVANGLKKKGIKKGDKVALSCPNVPFFPMVYYGILKTGAKVVPLNVLLKKREIIYHLEDSKVKFYFCFEGTDMLPMGKEGWEGFQEVISRISIYRVSIPSMGDLATMSAVINQKYLQEITS